MECKWNIKFIMKTGHEVNALYNTKQSNSKDVFDEITEYLNRGNGSWIALNTKNYGEVVSVKLSEVVAIQLSLPDC